MDPFLIILFALWIYPLIGLILFALTKKRLKVRKNALIITGFLTALAFFGILTGISTTLATLDWVIITTPYLFVCMILWWGQYQKRLIIKVVSIIGMVIIFGIGYFSGSIGILGVGFITGYYEGHSEKWFDKGLIYKEYSLGNAISDTRGKRIEISRTIKWLPVIEWPVANKDYFNFIVYQEPLDVKYKKENNEFILNAEVNWSDTIYHWNDTIKLKNKSH